MLGAPSDQMASSGSDEKGSKSKFRAFLDPITVSHLSENAVGADRCEGFSRLLRRSLPLLGAAWLAGAALDLHGADAAARDVRTAQVDGHAVAYQVLGHGGPVLVLISGLGDGMDTFKAVAPDLAKSATVIVYDRAGYGGSGRAAAIRDAAAADRELVGLLKASGVKGPYVIAGHSLGGLYAEYFAAHHPGEVAGLILEDSRPADFTRRCQAAKLPLCVIPPILERFMSNGARAELAGLDDTLAQVAAVVRPLPKPVLVLSHPVGPNAKPFDALWKAAQADLAARYPGSRHLTAPAGGHYIHKDQGAWFVSRVADFLAPMRCPATASPCA